MSQHPGSSLSGRFRGTCNALVEVYTVVPEHKKRPNGLSHLVRLMIYSTTTAVPLALTISMEPLPPMVW